MSENEIRHSASGSIELIGDNWLYLRLETLLPNGKSNAGIKLVANTINNLLDYYSSYYGGLPQYEDAFLAIIEHCGKDNGGSFDNDNKGFRAVPNALKGRVFGDDNRFELSMGLFTRESAEMYTEIYVLPLSDLAYFAMDYLNY